MKKSYIIVALIMVMIFSTSCSTVKNNDDATIQIWWYDYENSEYYRDAVTSIIVKVTLYCKTNNIPFEVVRYSEKMISYDNYTLKRNAAMATGNVIVIDDARKLADISKQHYDYSKLERYDTLMDLYKDKYCIPLGVGYKTMSVSDEIFDYYNISMDKDIITYIEYLDIKKTIKDKGAIFLFNSLEWKELIDHNLIKNNLYKISDKNKIIDDEDNFMAAIKKTVIGIYDDYKLYYDSYSDINSLDEEQSDDYIDMYDVNSKINLLSDSRINYLTNYYQYVPYSEDDFDRTYILMPDYTALSPSVFIHKKVTNEQVIDVVNQFLDVSYYRTFVYIVIDGQVVNSPYFSPTFDTADMRTYAEVNNNWEYIGIFMKHVDRELENYILGVDRINKVYDLLYKSGETSMQNADYYFNNEKYNSAITEVVNDLAKMLISENMDYNNKETDRLLNREINEFMMNFYVHFN